MRRKLKDTIEREPAALEEHVSPVPPIILDDVVRLGLHPQVERNQRDAPDPPGARDRHEARASAESGWGALPHDVDRQGEAGGDAEARECEHAVCEEVTREAGVSV